MTEVEFLFDNQLISQVETLIKDAKNRLLLVSPFIDLDPRIQDALREKQSRHDFKLLVLFGKNENNLYKSIKRDSLGFLKQFPNIEIRYNDRLHAKFYQNDFNFIMTSLNLYDYSLAKNIEVGILCNYASKGMLFRVLDSTDNLISQGTDKIKHDVLGFKNEVNPIEKFQLIFDQSELMYKTEPILTEKDGFIGFIGAKKLDGFKVLVDKLNSLNLNSKSERNSEEIQSNSNISVTIKASSKTASASQLSKTFGITQSDIINLMQVKGFIKDDVITEKGKLNGLVLKNYMGKDYISYPVNLPEFEELKK